MSGYRLLRFWDRPADITGRSEVQKRGKPTGSSVFRRQLSGVPARMATVSMPCHTVKIEFQKLTTSQHHKRALKLVEQWDLRSHLLVPTALPARRCDACTVDPQDRRICVYHEASLLAISTIVYSLVLCRVRSMGPSLHVRCHNACVALLVSKYTRYLLTA